MKTLVLFIVCITFAAACQRESDPNQQANHQIVNVSQDKAQATPEIVEDVQDVFEGRLTPIAIEDCLRNLRIAEPFEFDLSLNPFYLRLDMFGDQVTDYALVIRGRNSKKLGLLICKDAKEPILLGELSRPTNPLTEMENDNFIGAYWDVANRNEFRKLFLETKSDEFKRPADAKGELLVFSYAIDGVTYIWWDGKGFRAFSQ